MRAPTPRALALFHAWVSDACALARGLSYALGHLVPLSRGAAGVMARRAVYRRGRERGSHARGGSVFPTDAMGIAYIPDPCPHVGGCDCVPDTVAGL